jgi:hypothetical protein
MSVSVRNMNISHIGFLKKTLFDNSGAYTKSLTCLSFKEVFRYIHIPVAYLLKTAVSAHLSIHLQLLRNWWMDFH